MSGSTNKTLMSIDVSIENTIFRDISLGLVKASAIYNSKKLVFKDFSSNWNGNYIKGSASLPLDFDIASPNINKWDPNGKINIRTNGII